jgi:DNA polymerase II small subunit
MKNVTYEAPAEAMKEMLKKRHLAPMWGERNALSPEEEDQMTIIKKPDIFVTGHTHAHQQEWYRGTQLIVSSTWQGQSDFMRMLGYKPKMGYLSVYNIQNRESKAIQFVDQNNPSAGVG